MIDLIEQLKREITASTGMQPTHIKIGQIIFEMIKTEVKYQQYIVSITPGEPIAICGLLVEQSDEELFIGMW